MPLTARRNPVQVRLTRYLDTCFEYLAERLTPRIAERLDQEWAATVDVMTDPELVADLRRADQESDHDAQPYEEIRRVDNRLAFEVWADAR